MKKFLAVLCCVMMCLSLVACGGNGGQAGSGDASNSASESGSSEMEKFIASIPPIRSKNPLNAVQ